MLMVEPQTEKTPKGSPLQPHNLYTAPPNTTPTPSFFFSHAAARKAEAQRQSILSTYLVSIYF